MALPNCSPEFLPLTVSASGHTAATAEVHRSAVAADATAADAWVGLLAGCRAPGRRGLPAQLRALTEATASYVGTSWWFSDGSAHRNRVTESQLRIEDAVREGDGEEFAESLAAFDQAVATAVVCAPRAEGTLPLQRHDEVGTNQAR
ncbi:MAG: hypothetical protein ACRDRN_01525 [Sciscionella sp.]